MRRFKFTHNGVFDFTNPPFSGQQMVVTGTLENGRRVVPSGTLGMNPGTAPQCQSWSSNSSSVGVAIGLNALQDLAWTGLRASGTCERTDYRIYCFEQ